MIREYRLRPVARFADFQDIEQPQFEHEVLLVGSSRTGLGLVDVGEVDFGDERKFRTPRTWLLVPASPETFRAVRQ